MRLLVSRPPVSEINSSGTHSIQSDPMFARRAARQPAQPAGYPPRLWQPRVVVQSSHSVVLRRPFLRPCVRHPHQSLPSHRRAPRATTAPLQGRRHVRREQRTVALSGVLQGTARAAKCGRTCVRATPRHVTPPLLTGRWNNGPFLRERIEDNVAGPGLVRRPSGHGRGTARGTAGGASGRSRASPADLLESQCLSMTPGTGAPSVWPPVAAPRLLSHFWATPVA